MKKVNQDWLSSSRQLDWTYSYVDEKQVFPETMSGAPWHPNTFWEKMEAGPRISFFEYLKTQHEKELNVRALHDAIGRGEDFRSFPAQWLSQLKFNFAAFPLMEFTGLVTGLREARFGRTSEWRQISVMGALDKFRHSQIFLFLLNELGVTDPQFKWARKLYFSESWFSAALRHLVDEAFLTQNALEHTIASHFVFERSFLSPQFIGLASSAQKVGDRLFEKLIQSIQSDETRRTHIGLSVLALMAQSDSAWTQKVVEKWFWRSWIIFSVTMGFAIDYLTPLEKRTFSFKEFAEEWVIPPFLENLEQHGLKKPWYWQHFLTGLENYHHMVYAMAYSYRSTLWFDLGLPSPQERNWLHRKYPQSWHPFQKIWENLDQKWKNGTCNELGIHATSLPAFCDTCQMPLCGGTPTHNTASTAKFEGNKYIFCSDPCQRIFEEHPQFYISRLGLVKKFLAGETPGNLFSLLDYFGLDEKSRGKDLAQGHYPWLKE